MSSKYFLSSMTNNTTGRKHVTNMYDKHSRFIDIWNRSKSII